MLNATERGLFTVAFKDIYNSLTQRSCDSYFRRITNLAWVNMTNTIGDFVIMKGPSPSVSDVNNATQNQTSEGTRNLQMRPVQAPTPAPEVDFNTTSTPGVNVVYEVTGTCRDCPISRGSGSFQLYDDAFRRALEETSGIKIRVRQLQAQSTRITTVSEEDCQCVEGTSPITPQAPGVQECVDEMNLELETIRGEQGLFSNLSMTDLKQLDEEDPFDLLEAEEAPVFDSEMEVDRNNIDVDIWGRLRRLEMTISESNEDIDAAELEETTGNVQSSSAVSWLNIVSMVAAAVTLAVLPFEQW